MNQSSVTMAETGTGKSGIWRLALLALIVLALAAGAFLGYRAWDASRKAAETARIAEMQAEAQAAIADSLGVRITRVMVTADGGLVDLRYEVVDPDKAIFLFDNVSVVPKMIAPNGTEIVLMDTPHRHSMEPGLAYFILYRNAGDSIKPGDEITVVVNDIRLEHFKVEP